MAVFVLASAAMMIQGYSNIQVYQAQAQILIEDERSTAVPGITSTDNTYYQDPEPYYQTQYRILRGRDLSRQVWGRDIKHVALLHLGSFSPHILPDLFALLKREGYRIITLEQAQSDPIYASDPDVADAGGGTLTELMMQAKGISWPEGLGDKPREKLASICK